MSRPDRVDLSVPWRLYELLVRIQPPDRQPPRAKDGSVDRRKAAGVVWKIEAAVDEALRSWRAKYPGLEVFAITEDQREPKTEDER